MYDITNNLNQTKIEDSDRLSFLRKLSFLQLLTAAVFFAVVVAILIFSIKVPDSSFAHSVNKNFVAMFSDFSQVMIFALHRDAYTVLGTSYLPVGLICNLPFALICLRPITQMPNAGLNMLNDLNFLLNYPEFYISLILYYVTLTSLCMLIIKKLCKLSGNELFYVSIIFIFSGAMVFSVLRGSSILTTLLFTLLFLNYYNSKSRVKSELALVFLAIAGTIKLYPLFFGVYLICKKQWVSCIKVACYFIILALVPFMFYEGGFAQSLPAYLHNLGKFATKNVFKIGVINLSFAAFVYRIIFYIGSAFNVGPQIWWYNVAVFFSILLFALCTVTAIMTDSKTVRSICCFTAVVGIAPPSYAYTLVFALPVLATFLENIDSLSKKQQKGALWFCLLFMCPIMLAGAYLGILTVLLVVIVSVSLAKAVQLRLAQKRNKCTP